MWDIEADADYHVVWPNDRLLPMVPNAVVAIYTIQGSGHIKLKSGKEITVSAPSVTFLDSSKIKSYKTNGVLWELNWFEFVVQGLINIPVEQPILLANEEYPEMLNDVKKLILSNEPTKMSAAVAGFSYLFYKWLTLSDNVKNITNKDKITADVIALMNENIGKNVQIKSFAEQVGYTEQYLRKVFLKKMDITPKKYFLKLKLEAGMMMLKKEGYSVKSVAYSLGFNDSFHFSRAFKSYFDVCPSSISKER
ncbi:AraC family transcriptional regulator [Vibrio sp. SS-MA-C1-2]|uniref:AraC family transcriptional regulator n=1 Tax=Vibrio sp. SS-MA-C1-2 TaxID=2908646 RepID=UPI001F3CDF4E|nr:AraC family transcriptional regulator [Vibrio sp. SS-MA-C1-2]UJF17712.1 AraC family transcriptional regulator [Vibrio sp. SS-MA-C1-2]